MDRERIERLIVRKLDGELSGNDGIELDRLMLRDPDARRLFDEYKQIDAWSASVVATLVPPEQLPSDQSRARRTSRDRRIHWWLVPSALAACVASFIFAWQGGLHTDTAPGSNADRLMIGTAPGVSAQPPAQMIHRVSDHAANRTPSAVSRHRDRELIGVVADDGSIYWIESNRTVTIEVPGHRARITSTGQM